MPRDDDDFDAMLFGPPARPETGSAAIFHAKQLRARVDRGEAMTGSELALLSHYENEAKKR